MPEPDLAPGLPVAGTGRGAPTIPLREPRWGLGDAIVGWLVAQFGGLVMVSLVLGVSGESYDDLSFGLLAVAQTGLWAGFLGAPWLAARFKGNGMAADFGLRETPRQVVPDLLNGGFWGLFSQFVMIPVLYLPLLLLTDIDGDDLSEAARDLTDRASDAFGTVLLVLIVGIAVPILEELFWRGLVLRATERRFGTRWAVVGSGVLFGVSHFQPLQMPALAVFGIVLGLLTVRNGRLGPAIAAHMAFNMSTVIIMLN